MPTVILFFQAEDGIRDLTVTGVQTCALPISEGAVQLYAGAFHRRRRLDDPLDGSNGHDGPRGVGKPSMWGRRTGSSRPSASRAGLSYQFRNEMTRVPGAAQHGPRPSAARAGGSGALQTRV